MKRKSMLFGLIAGLILPVAPSMALDQELLKHPEAGVVSYYQTNKDQVETLQDAVANGETPAARVDALNALIKDFPEAAAISARDHVTDTDDAVAVAAANFLIGELVMTHHGHGSEHQAVLPRIKYVMDVHSRGREALRKAITDNREFLRAPVAKFFASQSDQVALDLISKGTEDGLYTEANAASLYALSSGPVALKYLDKYIGKGTRKAQEIAVGYAGYFPNYHKQLREKYLANKDAVESARVVAAEVLSKYDPGFAEYALLVADERNTSGELFSTVVRGYMSALEKKNRLDTSMARLLEQRIKNYQEDVGDRLNQRIMNRLEGLQRSLSNIRGDNI